LPHFQLEEEEREEREGGERRKSAGGAEAGAGVRAQRGGQKG
jgi:hypothetical protein